MVLDTVAPRSALRGTTGADATPEAREELLLLMQERAAAQRYGWLFPCPTCVRLVHGVSGEQAARDEALDAVLTARGVRLRCARTALAMHFS
jgi:hypothetical protein